MQRTDAWASWSIRAILLAFLTVAPVQAVRPMVSYRALELDATTIEIGVLAGAYAMLSVVAAIPIGRWIDRTHPTPFLIASSIGVAFSALLFTRAEGLLLLGISQALLGLTQIVGLIALQTLLSNAGVAADRDRRIAAFTIFGAVGQMLGPATAGLLFQLTGTVDTVFVVAAAVAGSGVALAASFVLRPAPLPENLTGDGSHSQQSMGQDVWRVTSVRGVTPSIIAGVAVLTSIDLLIAYLPAYGEARGIAPATIGLMLGAQAAGAVLSRLFMVRLIGQLGRRRTLAASMLAPTIGLLLLPLTGSVPTLFVLVVIAGLGLGLGQPLSLSLVVAEVDERLRGTAIGVRLTSNRIGQLVLPALVGGLAGGAGVGGIFTASGLLLGASSAVMFRVRTASEAAGHEHGSSRTN